MSPVRPMAVDISSRTLVEDHWIRHPEGRMFCRSWTPAVEADCVQPPAPIFLFHDSLGCVDLWREFPERLAQATGRRVIAYDRLGFGRSDPRPHRPSLDFIAEEAGRYFPHVRNQLDVERFVVLGHSVGGGMGIHCAAAFPQSCEALITESAQVFAEDRTLASIRDARSRFMDPEQTQRLARYHGAKAAWVLDAWTENWLDPGFARWSLLDVLPGVKCPVLAIHGEDDEYGSIRHPFLIAEKVAGESRMAILPATGHVPHRENKERVVHIAGEFLAAA